MSDTITSLQNPRIKNILHLSKASERRKQDLIVIEGSREIAMAFHSGMEIKELYVAAEIESDAARQLAASLSHTCEVVQISKVVFEKVAYRDNSDGLIALAVPRYRGLGELALGKTPLLLVLEAPEKPGNLGAILRTADAAAIDAVIVCDPHTDIYNPNVIRASLGCIFTGQIITCSSEDALNYLKERGITSYAAALTAQQYYYEADFTRPCAIVMGSEAWGLTDLWLNGADTQIMIPMGGKVDSLNLSTSAAILVFDAKRQRDCSRGI